MSRRKIFVRSYTAFGCAIRSFFPVSGRNRNYPEKRLEKPREFQEKERGHGSALRTPLFSGYVQVFWIPVSLHAVQCGHERGEREMRRIRSLRKRTRSRASHLLRPLCASASRAGKLRHRRL